MIWRAIITLCLLVALTLSSFGHRTLSASDEAQASAFILAGGDWAELCSDSDDPLATAAKCMACVIAQTCVLSFDPPFVHSIGRATELDVPQTSLNFTTNHNASPYPARAPPFV